jgi:hypothetical protein
MTEPLTREQLASELSRLSSEQPQTLEDLGQLERESTALLLRLRDSSGFDVPELVWHFLSDADVRFKDSRYASAQMEGLSDALLVLRQGSGST